MSVHGSLPTCQADFSITNCVLSICVSVLLFTHRPRYRTLPDDTFRNLSDLTPTWPGTLKGPSRQTPAGRPVAARDVPCRQNGRSRPLTLPVRSKVPRKPKIGCTFPGGLLVLRPAGCPRRPRNQTLIFVSTSLYYIPRHGYLSPACSGLQSRFLDYTFMVHQRHIHSRPPVLTRPGPLLLDSVHGTPQRRAADADPDTTLTRFSFAPYSSP